MKAHFRVTGYREADRAFRKLEGSSKTLFREDLVRLAEPVAATARSRVSRYRGASTNITPKALAGGVVVRQNQRKVTGLRGDFGSLQMRKAFIPALEQHADEIHKGLEDVLDKHIDSAGF